MKPFRIWIYSLITRFIPETRCFALKRGLLRWCGVQVGKNVRLCSSAVIGGNGRLVIGDEAWIGPRAFIFSSSPSEISIGQCCDIAPQVTIVTGSHEIDFDGPHVAGKGKSASVRIGDGSWVCARAVILPGVTLAEKTLVAAAAVVTKSHAQTKTILVGVPACPKAIKK